MPLYIERILLDNITTVTRDALPAADKPKGTVIFNVTTNEMEVNKGTGAAPNWESATAETLSEILANGNTSGANDIIMADGQKVQFGAAGNEIVGNGADVDVTASGDLKLGFDGQTFIFCQVAGQYFLQPDVSPVNFQTSLLNTRTTFNVQGNGTQNGRLQTTHGNGTSFTQQEQGSGNTQINFGGITLYIINGTKAAVDTAIRGQTDNNAFYLDASADSVGIGTALPSEKLEVNGNTKADNFIGVSKLGYNVVSKTNADSPYSTGDGEVVLCDATAGNITVNLPTTASNSGAQINIKKTDASANTITIDGSGGQTIDGGLTATLTAQYESITIVTDGSNWFII